VFFPSTGKMQRGFQERWFGNCEFYCKGWRQKPFLAKKKVVWRIGRVRWRKMVTLMTVELV
jgi:hypothetical protein